MKIKDSLLLMKFNKRMRMSELEIGSREQKLRECKNAILRELEE